MKNSRSVIVVNITHNPTGWRNTYTNPHAGHKYARVYPGRESLNFKFDKRNIDSAATIHGFAQWTRPPRDFKAGGVILLYSKNLASGKSEIVGIYGGASILQEAKRYRYPGFQNDQYLVNLRAQARLSMLFPIPLRASRYSRRRLVGQVGFAYKDVEFARKTLELRIPNQSGS